MKLSKDIIYKLKSNAIVINTIKLTSVSMLSNFLGFLIPIYIAYKYVISKETDNFFLSYSIILFISTMFSAAVRSVSVPFLKEEYHKGGTSFEDFISSIIYYITKYIGLLCIVLFIACYSIKEYTNNDLYWYLMLSVPIVFLSIINSFFFGILNSLDEYYVAELSPLSRALIIFLIIFAFSDKWGIAAVIIGYNLGEFFKFIHLFYILKIRKKLHIKFLYHNYSIVRRFLKEGSYQIISATIVSATPMVDRVVASFLVAGSISLLDYGDKVYMVFNVVLNSFLVLLLSKWSKDALLNNFDIKKLNGTMAVLFMVNIVIAIFVFLFKDFIIQMLYPTVSRENQDLIAMIFFINMIGFTFNSISQVINRATIALKLTNIMIITASWRLVSNIIFDIYFSTKWGILGIAVAAVFVHIIGLSVNYYHFKKRTKLILAN